MTSLTDCIGKDSWGFQLSLFLSVSCLQEPLFEILFARNLAHSYYELLVVHWWIEVKGERCLVLNFSTNRGPRFEGGPTSKNSIGKILSSANIRSNEAFRFKSGNCGCVLCRKVCIFLWAWVDVETSKAPSLSANSPSTGSILSKFYSYSSDFNWIMLGIGFKRWKAYLGVKGLVLWILLGRVRVRLGNVVGDFPLKSV